MKLLFENWRRYLNEASVQPEESKRIEALLKEISPKGDWSVLKKLGKGQGGQVYLIQSENTIERRALKVIEPGSRFYDRESPNYAWVANNRDSLPEEVKKHLPKVFSVDRTKSGVDLIQMEVLTSAPEDVLADLIVPYSSKRSATKRQAEVLLSDIDKVGDLVSRITSDAVYILDVTELSPRAKKTIAKSLEKKIMGEWQSFYDSSVGAVFPGQKVPKFFDPSPKWEDPLGELKKIITAILGTELKKILDSFDVSWLKGPVSDRMVKSSIDSAIYFLNDELNKAPVPLGVANKSGYNYSLSPDKSALFPEAQGIITAINILKDKYGFIANDVHSGNVMARPKSGDLVIVDLGLFKQKTSSK